MAAAHPNRSGAQGRADRCRVPSVGKDGATGVGVAAELTVLPTEVPIGGEPARVGWTTGAILASGAAADSVDESVDVPSVRAAQQRGWDGRAGRRRVSWPMRLSDGPLQLRCRGRIFVYSGVCWATKPKTGTVGTM